LGVVAILAVALAVGACGDDRSDDSAAPADPGNSGYQQAPASDGPEHVHGLGIDPSDGALYIATHTGLFRAAEGESKSKRVGDSRQDIMGFSIPEKGRFIGSGHPDPSDTGQPPNLGLMESRDGGRSWKQISLAGEADFHVLRSAGGRVYGFNGLQSALMVSDDGGREWESHSPPGPMLDLAIDPRDPDSVVAATDQGLSSSTNGGRSWRQLDAAPGLLAWSKPAALYLVDGQGGVARSEDGGRRWREGIGSIGGQPAAFMANGKQLYVALHDGTVKVSDDGGASWAVRSTP
jgi:hypothetical protein